MNNACSQCVKIKNCLAAAEEECIFKKIDHSLRFDETVHISSFWALCEEERVEKRMRDIRVGLWFGQHLGMHIFGIA